MNDDYSNDHYKRCLKKHKKHKKKYKESCLPEYADNVYDFIIVGLGNSGCVLANRLSESGKFRVCALEYGRDDARLSELLPEISSAPVPQPKDYNWGKYTRGAPAPTEFPAILLNKGFGHLEWFQREDANGPVPFRSTTYARHSGWGGCTSHNFTFSVRNAPHNWNKWKELGLTDWDASEPNSNLIKYYKMVENRSQLISKDLPFYNSSINEPNFGSFPKNGDYYGYNGNVPLLHFGPPLNTQNPFLDILLSSINKLFPNYGYPKNLIDLDWPPTADKGGLSYNNFTQSFQFGEIIPPGKDNHVPFEKYNPYKDKGFSYPPEFERLGLTGLLPTQRASSANTYLYSAEGRKNLTIKSEVLVTKILIDEGRAKGVEYLEGWNIYQTGRNCNVSTAGYGGTRGDAKANSIGAKMKGTQKIYARNEVIICCGVYNTPHLLQLSGIGDKNELELVGIKSKINLPGVGKNLVDNHELFIFWEGQNPENLFTFAAKSELTKQYPNYDLVFGSINAMSLEARDSFIQKRWTSTKNTPAIYQPFVRNDFNNILISTDQNPTNKNDLIFSPIIKDNNNICSCLIEQEEDNRTTGYVTIVSNDPTIPPNIIFNYLQDKKDLEDWLNIMNNTVFPLLLNLKNTKYYTNLLDPAPIDFLKPGITYNTWNDITQVDQERLIQYLYQRVGGHHAGGTCKMGLFSKDPLSVVDQKGNVYGVNNLRICDNSIIPISIRWPNGTLYVIAEKISDDIIKKYS